MATAPPEREVDAAAATTSRSVLRGGLWYVASYGVPQAYTVVISIVAARFLGPSGMGLQSFIAFVSLSLTTLLSASMFTAVMRYVGESVGAGQRSALRGLLAWAWKIEGVAAVFAGGLLVGAAFFGAEPQGAWVLAGAVSAVGILQTVPSAALIGLQRFREAATVGLVTGLFATTAITLVLWQGGGITGMFAVEAVIGAVNLIWTGALARRALGPAEREEGGNVGDLRHRVARYALISGIGVTLDLVVATRSELFFLARYSEHAQFAYYSIAFAAVSALRLVPSAMGSTIAPAFATLFGAGADERIRSGYTRAFRLLLVVSLPLTAGAFVLMPELVRLAWGDEFAGVGPPLRILATAFPLVAVASLATAYLSGIGRLQIPLIANALAAAVDIGLAAGLVPVLDARGAAIANVGGQVVYGLYVVIASARLLGASDWGFGTLLRSVAASVIAGAAAWGVLAEIDGFAGLVVGCAVFAVIYAGLASVLRVLTPNDAKWLELAVGGRVGARVGRVARLLA